MVRQVRELTDAVVNANAGIAAATFFAYEFWMRCDVTRNLPSADWPRALFHICGNPNSNAHLH